MKLRALPFALAAANCCAYAQKTPPSQPPTIDVQIMPGIVIPLPRTADPDAPNAPLSADGAARIALRRQTALALARADVKFARGGAVVARSGLYPQVTVNSAANDIDTFKGTTAASSGTGATSKTQGFNSSAPVNQLIFDFDHTRDGARQAEAIQRSAVQALSNAQSLVVYQAKQAFYTYAQNTRLVSVDEANVKNRQDQLNLAQAQLDSGLGAPADVVTAKTQLDDAMQTLNLAQNAALASRIQLAVAMGIDPRTPIVAADAGEPATNADDMNRLVDFALAHRPDLLSAKESLRAAGYGVSFARTLNAPAISLGFGLGARGTVGPFDTETGSIGVSFTWTLDDGGFTAGRIEQAEADVDTAKVTLEQLAQTVISDVAQAYANLKSAQQRVTVAQAEQTNAQEGMNLAQGRYRSGIALFIEVTTAQAALVTAQVDLVNAITSVDLAFAQLQKALGSGLANPSSPQTMVAKRG